MDNRGLINDKVVQWVEHRVKTKYFNDISMVLLCGSYINGTANNSSDVDCYFIPKTDRGYEMAIDFIIEGTGYDIFSMSGDRVERISELKEILFPCVGDVEILYYHSKEDLEKFKQLQRNLQQNLEDTSYIKNIIEKKFQNTCDMYSEMSVSSNTVTIRKLAGAIIMTLADSIALYNHDYFHFGLKRQWEDLQSKFPTVPKEFINEYRNVIQSTTDTAYIKHCFKLLKITADYLNLKFQVKETIFQKSTAKTSRQIIIY